MNITDHPSSVFIDTILFFDQLVSRYCLGVLFILGTIGLTLNTIIFTRKTLRNTSCILYFFSSNLANYLVVYFVIPCRLLSDGFNIDPATSSLHFCKFREYTLTVSRTLSAWFIVLASFDRFMSGSRNIHRRQFCHVNIARWTICMTTIFCLLFYIHILIFFTNYIRHDQCEAPTRIYRVLNDCIYSICYVIIPSILMFIFGLLTIFNQKQHRIIPALALLNKIKRDRNLYLMFFFQFILFTSTTLPHAVQKLYITIIYDDENNDYVQNVTNTFFIHTARMISFINHSCQFYIFTLSSKLFRQELKKFARQFKWIRRQQFAAAINMNNNRIHFQPIRKFH